jgi:hypothetical protein
MVLLIGYAGLRLSDVATALYQTIAPSTELRRTADPRTACVAEPRRARIRAWRLFVLVARPYALRRPRYLNREAAQLADALRVGIESAGAQAARRAALNTPAGAAPRKRAHCSRRSFQQLDR